MTTNVAKAIVVDFMYATVFVSNVSPNDQPYLYKFQVKTPVTIAAMKTPMYANLDANLAFMRCFFGFLGGLDIMSFSIGSTPSARAGRMSVPTFTVRMRTAVSGVGREIRIAPNININSPMLQENM